MAPKLLILLDRSIEQPRLAWGAWGLVDWVFCCRCPCLGENRQILYFLGQVGFYVGKSDVIATPLCWSSRLRLKLVGLHLVLLVRTSFTPKKIQNCPQCFLHFRISWDIGATRSRDPVVVDHHLHFFYPCLV